MIDHNAFYNCTALKTINLNNVTSIGREAFYGDTALKTVTLGNGLTYIGAYAFQKSGLTSVTIPANVKLGDDWGNYSTFRECPNLASVTVNNSLVGSNEFQDCPKLKTVRFGSKIRTIESNAFYNDTALTTVINGGDPAYIGRSAFENCTSLKYITLGSRLVHIGSYAFKNDSSLTTIRIPSTVVSFEDDWGTYATFNGCSNLKNVYIANTAMPEKDDAWNKMFGGCTKLVINTISNSPAYKFATNSVYSKKTFTAKPAKSVAFSKSNYTLLKGESLVLYPTMTPANSTDCYQFVSGDADVAPVNEYGVVTAKQTGETQIQVVTTSGKKAVCKIKIVESGKSSTDAPKKKSINLSSVSVVYPNYNGKAQTPAPTVLYNPTIQLVNGVDYTVTYSNNVKVGKANMVITGKGNYTGTIKTSFQIKGTDIKGGKATLKKSAYAYTGKAKKPAVTLKVGGKTLKKGTDYTVAYKNNKNVGTATVTIKGKGNYTGTITKTFKINPAKPTISKATSPKKGKVKVTYKKAAGAAGYQIVLAKNKKFTSGKKVVTAKGASKTVKGLTKGKTYFVKVRSYKKVGKTTYYSGYSKVLKVKVKK